MAGKFTSSHIDGTACRTDIPAQVAHPYSSRRLLVHNIGRVHPRCLEAGSRRILRAEMARTAGLSTRTSTGGREGELTNSRKACLRLKLINRSCISGVS